jgi:hypothetical protein
MQCGGILRGRAVNTLLENLGDLKRMYGEISGRVGVDFSNLCGVMWTT